MRYEDITGKTFADGRITVVGKSDRRKYDRLAWECKCECGNTFLATRKDLTIGRMKSCGCLRAKGGIPPPPITRDITDQRFNRLVAKYPTDKRHQRSVIWHCVCDCGNEVDVRLFSLINGETKSCGCLNIENRHAHGERIKREGQNRSIDGTNLRNLDQGLRSNNTSGIKGVSYNKSKSAWQANIGFKGISYYLGSYSDKEDAIAARKEAELRIHVEFLEWYAKAYPEQSARYNVANKIANIKLDTKQ